MDAATRILVVGGSPEPSSAETIRCAAAGCKAAVAVDRGLDALLAAGVSCDLFCGDADSVSEHGAELVRLCERDVPATPLAQRTLRTYRALRSFGITRIRTTPT